jgi:hypothetical protein
MFLHRLSTRGVRVARLPVGLRRSIWCDTAAEPSPPPITVPPRGIYAFGAPIRDLEYHELSRPDRMPSGYEEPPAPQADGSGRTSGGAGDRPPPPPPPPPTPPTAASEYFLGVASALGIIFALSVRRASSSEGSKDMVPIPTGPAPLSLPVPTRPDGHSSSPSSLSRAAAANTEVLQRITREESAVAAAWDVLGDIGSLVARIQSSPSPLPSAPPSGTLAPDSPPPENAASLLASQCPRAHSSAYTPWAWKQHPSPFTDEERRWMVFAS